MLTTRLTIRSRNSRSCAISSSVPGYSRSQLSSHRMASRSRWLVGSSSSSRSERHISALRDVEPHAPAAGERADRPRLVRGCEAEAVQQTCRAAARVVAAGRGVARRAARRASRRRCAASASAMRRSISRSSASPSSTNSIAGWSVASSSCETCATSRFDGHLERAGVRLQLAAHERQQAGLAAAVLAGDADLLAAKQAEGGAGEQHTGAAAYRDVGEIQHVVLEGRAGQPDWLDCAQMFKPPSAACGRFRRAPTC